MRINKRILSTVLIATLLISMVPNKFIQSTVNADTITTHTVQDSKILQYNFEETSGTTAVDSTGNNDGTLVGGASWSTSGKNNGAVNLDGSNGYVKIPNGVLNGLNNVTITSFVKVTKAVTNSWIMAFGPNSTNYIMLNSQSGSNKLRSAISTSSWGGEQGIDGTSTLTLNVWKHVALVISGDTKTETLYVDGVQVGQNTNVTCKPSQMYDSSKDYSGYIGKSAYNDPYFGGLVDDFIIYNRALSTDEIKTTIDPSISDIPAINVATKSSVAPVLPPYVSASYTIGASANVNVVWDSVDPASYASLGSFDVQGKVTGTTLKALAHVIVMEQPIITSTSKTDSTTTLNLSPIVGATGYKVYRSATSGVSYSNIYSGTDTSFIDSGLVTGKTYYYVMSYLKGGVESFMSEEVNVTTDLVKPAIPKGIAQGTTYPNVITINWNEVSGADNYVLYRKSAVGGQFSPIYEGDAKTYKDINLNAATTYYYAVSAKNGAGESAKSSELSAQTSKLNSSINSGQFLYDNNGDKLQAHGGCIIKVGDIYYWYGEDKTTDSANFYNVKCYSSKDLENWTFVKNVLTTTSKDTDGKPAAELTSCKVERPKVIYNDKTKKYVMWVHYENGTDYGLARVAVATSDTPDGDFIYEKNGSFNPTGKDSRDMTVFKDTDGSAYLISSSDVNSTLAVYKLSEDYTTVDSRINDIYTSAGGPYISREAPAIVKKDGLYYLITSGASGWYTNQAKYSTSTSMNGPWTPIKDIGNSSAFNSQSSYIITVQGTEKTSYILYSDRWIPSKLGNSTYIWMPLTLDGTSASMDYYDNFKIDVKTGKITIPQTQVLLSQGKPAVASNVVAGSSATNANDGNYSTNWLATNSSNWPAWWKVDLGERYNLSNVQISWFMMNGSEGYYKYKVMVSDDDINYKLAYDGTNNTTYGFTSDKLAGVTGRYVRFDVQKAVLWNNPNNNWYTPQLYEVKVYGSSMAAKVPSGLVATAVKTSDSDKTTSVNINWGVDQGETGYNLYRSNKLNGHYKKIYSGNSGSYNDYGLKNRKTYYYKVSALNSTGESAKSSAVSVTTLTVPASAITMTNGYGWYDTEGKPLEACYPSFKVGTTYYSYCARGATGVKGFNSLVCYTSKDMKNWTYKSVILNRDSSPELQSCKIEACNFTYNKTTKKYIMWMHYENTADYTLAKVAVAESDTPDGMFTYVGNSFNPNGHESRDVHLFQDDDGSAYLISASDGNANLRLYKLKPDYLSIDKELPMIYSGQKREAPSMVKKDGIYYLISSGTSGWYPNQAMYSTATSMEGPWTEPKNVGNSSTFSSQMGPIYTIKGCNTTSYFVMISRWLVPTAAESHVWLPLQLKDGNAYFDFCDSISIDVKSGNIIPITKGTLLSQGKPSTASDVSPNSFSSATKANDGDYNTNWTATDSSKWPAWWRVDLGEKCNLSNVQISWFMYNGSEAYYKYKIWVSDDDVTYTLALDRTDNKTYGFTSDMISSVAGRYVKIEMQTAVLQNNPGNWYTPQLYEAKVYGTIANKKKDAILGDITLDGKSLIGLASRTTSYNAANITR